MKIAYQRDGGLAFLPGLQRATAIDVEALEPSRADALTQLVHACGFFEQPAQVGAAAAGAADQLTEILTVECAGLRHQVRILGTPVDSQLAALLNLVREEVAARRQRQG